MKTTKIWILAIAMLAAFSLASCSSDDNVERRLTNSQKETYAQNISGEYPGKYIIVYKDKDCKEWTDEKGRHTEAHEETFSSVQLDVTDYKMQHVFFQDFPVSLISKVVDADKKLSEALAEASSQAITARYGFDYDTDYSHIKWAFIPNVMLLNLNYGGADHHIRIEFNNNSQYYTFTEDELKQPKAFRSIAENGIALQLEAIYDGPTLIQRFGSDTGNFMHIMFFIRKDVAEPAEKVVKSEADIEYEQQCPVEKYAIAKGGEYIVDADGRVTYADGTPTPEFDKHAQIYLENILDKSHPLWQAGARYQATYAYVLSPLTDEIRLVPGKSSAFLFKNILTDSEMAHIQQSMKQGETLRYALILCNVYKRGIQKVEFTIKKK